MKTSLAIISKDRTSRELLSQYLNSIGYQTTIFSTLAAFQPQEPPDLIIIENALISAEKNAQWLNADIQTPAIIIFETADQFEEKNAFSRTYGKIHKQMSMSEITPVLKAALTKAQKMQLRGPYSRFNIVGESPKMLELFKIMDKISVTPTATVLIRGESGTGKELIARALHYNSPKQSQPFVEINCAALPENLLESELFGYEKGAFTDARKTKPGLLELAQGGTFFLDEIGDLTPNLQAKLLKVIEEKIFRRLGGVDKIAVTMRIITATNRNLEKAIQERNFREDLYYRLNVISLFVPPLRERLEDIPLLSEYFIEVFNQTHAKNILGFTDGVFRQLLIYPWPGNVREIKNVIERAVLLENEKYISPAALSLGKGHVVAGRPRPKTEVDPLEIKIPPEGISLTGLEKSLLKKALEMAKGNHSKAGRLLGLTREAFRYRCKKFELDAGG
jgi:transcriptional regulator with PAS, ATPase and Fis domain